MTFLDYKIAFDHIKKTRTFDSFFSPKCTLFFLLCEILLIHCLMGKLVRKFFSTSKSHILSPLDLLIPSLDFAVV